MTTTAIKAAGSQPSNGSAGTGAAAGAQLVPIDTQSGIVLIPQPTDLTRLNYYDGKFLRAADLSAEQDYLRSLTALSNRAGGSGVVHGLDVKNAGNGTLTLTSGLAIDPRGRVIWLPYDATVNLAQLIERSREGAAGGGSTARAGGESFGGCTVESVSTSPPATGITGTDLYVITVCWAEALCGESDVYGKLCEDACVASTDRPFRLEGLVVRALPVSLGAPSCTATWLDARHRRSLVASAWFAAERAELGAAISGTRLRNGPWCTGATAATGDCVQLAVVAVTGGAIQFLDEWTARRERIEMPPLRYWQWQLAMRPRAVFLAQLLQFQCQLRDVLTTAPPVGGGNDPCSQQTALLRRAKELLAEIRQQYGAAPRDLRESGGREGRVDADRPLFLSSLQDLHHDVGTTLTQLEDVSASRVLVEGGIVELPPAGYLPVAIGPVDVQTQVQRLLGEGVELRVCSVRPDYIPHALEEAQHMERICLLQGLENPQNRPKVDILVPDGVVTEAKISVGGIPLQVRFRFEAVEVDWQDPFDTAGDVLTLTGAARAEPLDGGGAAFHFAGRGELAKRPREDRAQPAEPPQDANTAVGVPPAPSGAQPATATSAATATATGTAKTGFSGETTLASDATFSAQRSSLAADAVKRLFRRPVPGETTEGGVIGMQQSTLPPSSPPQSPSSPPRSSPSSPPERETADFSPAVWATVRVGGNPWELAIGESLPLHGEFAMSMEGGRDSELLAVEVMVDADLYRDQGTGGTLSGRARGFAVVRTPDVPPASSFESIPVELALQMGSGGGGALAITLLVGDGRSRIVTRWSPRPVSATTDGELDWVEQALGQVADLPAADREVARQSILAAAERDPGLRHLPFLHVDALENAEVLKSGNGYHERAISALSDLQELLREPGFRAAGETRLFAPDRQVQAAATVRATRDWVLFHRRRDNSCDCTCAQDATQVLRRYRFYHVQAPAEATLAQIRAALAGTAEIEGIETVPVLPRFAADASVLLNGRREVLDAWGEMNLGAEIVYGAVAAAGAGSADPGALLDARIEALGGVVDDATPAPRAVYDVLPAMPPSLDAGGVDGVMVIVTRAAPVQDHCHRAYALGDQGTMDSVIRMAKAGSGLGDWLAGNATVLGRVRFDDGSTTPKDPLSPLLDAWNARYPDAKPGRAVTVALGSGSIPPSAAGEGGVIARALGTTLTDGVAATREAPGPIGCPFITLFEPGQPAPPVVHHLYRVENASRDGVTVWEDLRILIQSGQLNQALEKYPEFMLLLGDVTFAPDSTSVTDGDPAGWWSSTGQVPVDIAATVHADKADPQHVALLRAEAKAIAGLAGTPAPAQEMLASAQDLGGGADAITLLMTPVFTPEQPDTQPDCQTAYLLDPQLSRGVREQADTGAPYDAVALANGAQRGPVTVQFDSGTANLASEAASIENGVGTKRLMGFITLVDPNAGEDVLRLAHERSVTIAAAIGAGANTVALPPQRAGSAIPGGCGAITLILQNLG